MTAWPEPLTDAWYWVEERAATLEYDAGMKRPDAEKRALEELATRNIGWLLEKRGKNEQVWL